MQKFLEKSGSVDFCGFVQFSRNVRQSGFEDKHHLSGRIRVNRYENDRRQNPLNVEQPVRLGFDADECQQVIQNSGMLIEDDLECEGKRHCRNYGRYKIEELKNTVQFCLHV